MKKKLKKAAIITASGFGDGLIMLIAAHFLEKEGFEVSFFNPHLSSLKSCLPKYKFSPFLKEALSYKDFDLVLLQFDNSPLAKALVAQRKKLKKLLVLYPTYKESKHGPLEPQDYVFNSNISMVDNLANFGKESFLKKPSFEKDIGLILPSNLIHKKHKKRVVIHPTSSSPERTWTYKKFLKLYQMLKKKGYDPYFILSEKESSFIKKNLFQVVNFQKLSDLCAFFYESSYFIGNESGPSHLASYLKIPSIVIAGNAKRIKLWQPGWYKEKTSIITPPSYVPNFKPFRLKTNKWQLFISPKRIIKTFLRLTLNE